MTFVVEAISVEKDMSDDWIVVGDWFSKEQNV